MHNVFSDCLTDRDRNFAFIISRNYGITGNPTSSSGDEDATPNVEICDARSQSLNHLLEELVNLIQIYFCLNKRKKIHE
jgi:hypothetical protein